MLECAILHKKIRKGGYEMPPLVASVKAIMPSGMVVHVKRFESHRKACIFVEDMRREFHVRFKARLYVSKDVPSEFDHLDVIKRLRG